MKFKNIFTFCLHLVILYFIYSLFLDEDISSNEPIEPDKDSVREEPYSLPSDFQWDTLNLEDPAILTELYDLLSKNYVEDDDAMFRFDYPPTFLKW